MSQAKATIEQLSGAVHQNRPLTVSGIEERVFSSLFRGLVYAQIWEDPVADMAALEIGPDSNLVCIASGGCNMMSYLTAGPASIEAVDLSPAHVALGRLKLAAVRVLPDHADFYDLFGHADRPGNRALYDRLAPVLDPETRAWWEGRQGPLRRRRVDMLCTGLYRHGVLGKFIGSAHLLSRLGRVDYRPLLAAHTMEAQQAFFDTQIAPLFERPLVRWVARRKGSLFGLGIPPQQYEKLARDGGGDIVAVLRERMRKLICDFPVSGNYFAWAAFNRGYRADGAGPVPPYLEARHFETVKAHAAKVRLSHRSLTEMLAEIPSASRHGYVLLDAQDWMTDAQLDALWTEITRTAVPGATVVFRTGGTEDILPGHVTARLLDRWKREDALSARLWAEDRSAIYGGLFVYRFAG